MKIILKENIENLGKRGDIINVAAGYGRNYLIPRKLAIQVTPRNMKMIEMEQKALRKKLHREVESFQSVIDQLNQVSLSFERKAGDKDVIFGSVSISDIKEELDKLGIEVEKKKILLADPIKRLGNFTVPIKVFHDERAEIKIEVIKEGADLQEKKPAESEGMPVEERKEEKPDEKSEEIAAPAETEGESESPEDEIKQESGAEEEKDQTETEPEEPEIRPESAEEVKTEEASGDSIEEKKDE